MGIDEFAADVMRRLQRIEEDAAAARQSAELAVGAVAALAREQLGKEMAVRRFDEEVVAFVEETVATVSRIVLRHREPAQAPPSTS